jgi:isopenicillin N synthase-like dioxygenase
VPDVCIERMIESARAFIDCRSRETKDRARPAHAWRGFTALGSEVTRGRRDWHECLDVMTEVDGDDDASSPLLGRNQWPEHPAEFRDVVMTSTR